MWFFFNIANISTYEKLLEWDQRVVTHDVLNLRALMIKVFWSLIRLNPEIMWDIMFKFKPSQVRYLSKSATNINLEICFKLHCF